MQEVILFIVIDRIDKDKVSGVALGNRKSGNEENYIITLPPVMNYIYWFSLFDQSSPSVRYRGLYLLEALKKEHGVDYVIVYPGYSFLTISRFLKSYFSALLFRKKKSLIVIQRVYTKRIYATALKLLVVVRKKHTLYDIDDAEYVEHDPDTIHFFMNHCAGCSTGSHALMDYAKQFNHNVFVLTTPVTRHHHRKENLNNVFTIGWIGCFWGTHKANLYQLFLPGILEADFPLKFSILGVRSEAYREELQRYYCGNPNIQLDIPDEIDWFDEDAIYKRIKQFDIGISPLMDTEINRCKSAYKLKQYFSCGVPVLGSSVGENSCFLVHGMNGFICNNPEEYYGEIRKVKAMRQEEYDALSSNAIRMVAQFDLDHSCRVLLSRYRPLV